MIPVHYEHLKMPSQRIKDGFKKNVKLNQKK